MVVGPATRANKDSPMKLHRLPGHVVLVLLGLMLASLVAWGNSAQAAGLLGLLEREVDSDSRQCQAGSAAEVAPEVIDEIFPDIIYKTPSRDHGSEQLFRPIRQVAEPLTRLGSACLAGDTASCRRFQSWTQSLVAADALRFDREKHRPSPVSFVAGTLSGNLTIRPIATYADALREKGLIRFDAEAFSAWLHRRVAEYDHFPTRLNPGAAQNMVLNSVLAQLTADMVGTVPSSVTNAPSLVRAQQLYRLYLDTARKDGSLPAETRRGISALKYSNMATGGLVVLAELTQASSTRLYDYTSPNGIDLHQVVSFLVKAMADDSVIADYAKENYAPTDKVNGLGQARAYTRDQLGWMTLYIRRFPAHQNTRALAAYLDIATRSSWGYFDEIVGAYMGCNY